MRAGRAAGSVKAAVGEGNCGRIRSTVMGSSAASHMLPKGESSSSAGGEIFSF